MSALPMRALFVVVTAAVLALSACAEEERAPIAVRPTGDMASRCTGAGSTVEVEEQEAPDVRCKGQEDGVLCLGEWAARCQDGKLKAIDNCALDDLVCVAQRCRGDTCDGCRVCREDDVRCESDGALLRCNGEGSDYVEADVCDEVAGLSCNLSSGMCEDLCAEAEEAGSYIGCEYWAVPTRNAQLDLQGTDAAGLCEPFSFAIVISNPQGVTATVTVDAAGGATQTLKLPPSGVKTVELPCDPRLKGAFDEPDGTVLTAEVAAHRVRSNVPVTVYQFNPLEFEAEPTEDDRVWSHTNDASLLLPVHAMTGHYVVMSQPTLMHEKSLIEGDETLDSAIVSGPGFVAIVGVEDSPTKVTIASSAHTLPSADGAVPALAPGDRLTVALARGQVLQLLSAAPEKCSGKESNTRRGLRTRYCEVGEDYDLTGTRIESEGKVSVVAGHDCVFLPFDRWACDHIEETMLPLEAWGHEVTVSLSETVACQPTLPNLVRVLSATDGNRVGFTPRVTEPVVLDAGQYLDLEISEDVHIGATDAILVAQFLLGQDYKGFGSAGSRAKGDPSMSIAIPVEQWRKDYAFLTPESFTDNYVNLIAHQGQVVTLDGKLVQGFTTIEGTETAVARVPVKGGIHRAASPGGFGVVLYGYALYTSYMLPGGTDLNSINGPE
jgi:hypothetical protein